MEKAIRFLKEYYLIIILVAVALINAVLIHNSLMSIKDKQSKIGETIIINNDTLMVTDYSLLEDTYTLSNDKEMSTILFDKLYKTK